MTDGRVGTAASLDSTDAGGSTDATDTTDAIAQAWELARPDVDVTPIQVVGRILRGSKLILARGDALLGRYGLVRADFDILAALRRLGSAQTPTGLATHVIVGPAAMTKRLRKLETSGLVTRSVNPSDRRGFLIALTREGTALIDRLFPEQLGVEAELLAHMDEPDRHRTADLLRVLLSEWEAGPVAVVEQEN
jgi:DNA-binding MarR family transcriptional regulator